MRLYGKLAKQELQTRHDEIDCDKIDDLFGYTVAPTLQVVENRATYRSTQTSTQGRQQSPLPALRPQVRRVRRSKTVSEKTIGDIPGQ